MECSLSGALVVNSRGEFPRVVPESDSLEHKESI